MKNSILSIVKVLLMLSALNGCGSGGDNLATDDIRQAQVTISASPVFPYDPLTANKYTQLVSNHSGQEVSLVIDSPLSLTLSNSTLYLLATGQTESLPIIAIEGMDGWYQAGIKIDDPTRFTIETGTQADCITDNLTGLMWIKNLNTVNGGRATNWQNALDLIANANAGNGYCGYRDWYLPTVNELQSLVNYADKSSPAAWLNTRGFANVQAWNYWSSTSESDSGFVRFVFFYAGAVSVSGKAGNIHVWPVRRTGAATSALVRIPVTGETGGAAGSENGTAWPNPRFVVGSGATESCVSDKLTGLMWVRDLNTVRIKGSANGNYTSWQNALDSIIQANATGGYCGYTDWRLPNVNELKSLVNYGQSSPATWLNTQGFANVQTFIYWSSSSFPAPVAHEDDAWYVNFSYGNVSAEAKFVGNYVWPVRGGR